MNARAAAPVVSARGLHRQFARPGGGSLEVLRGVDLEIRPAESVAVVGASGCGKSTLLHLLGALDRPSSGQVLLGGKDTRTTADGELTRLRRQHVGFVFQFHHLLRDFSALENVLLPQLSVNGVTKAQATDRARELLDAVELQDRAAHRPAQLSGGEQQRVAVARALANRPTLLLADEPSGNLDDESTEPLHDLLFSLLVDQGSALAVVTHDKRLADRADRTMKLRGGVLHPA